jgi:hypothetical protein
MPPKELTAFRVAPDLMAAMRTVKEHEGIPIARQLDFAVRAWLKKKGVDVGGTAGPRARAKISKKGER